MKLVKCPQGHSGDSNFLTHTVQMKQARKEINPDKNTILLNPHGSDETFRTFQENA